MRSDRKNREEQEELSIFTTFTDLMSNAFMIMSFFLLLALFQSLELNSKLQNANNRLQSSSPIIIDEKSGQFKFKSGSAELTPELIKYIKQKITPQIQEIIKTKDLDFIQVIGHTDGQILGQAGNLDQNLEKVAQNQVNVQQLLPGSNADLGLMRALAVVQELQKQKELKKVKFRVYSAAQLYLPNGNLAPINRQQDEKRRRIEIRFVPPGNIK